MLGTIRGITRRIGLDCSVKPEKLDPCVAVWGNSPHWFGQFGWNSPHCLAVGGRLAELIGEAGEAISALHWCNVGHSEKPEKLAPCAAVGNNSPHGYGQHGGSNRRTVRGSRRNSPHWMWQSGGRICHFNLVSRDFFKNNSLNS